MRPLISILPLMTLLACAPAVPTLVAKEEWAKSELAASPVAIPKTGTYETVALIHGAMPTGITLSKGGRIFVNFPRWGDKVAYTVAEIRSDGIYPYPDEQTNKGSLENFEDRFVSVQSVVVDPLDRLWVLDTGSIQFGPVKPGAAKLVALDLATGAVVKKIVFPSDVVLASTYLNDVRFDLRRGEEGVAYITDSSLNGPNGIIVVDIASGRSFRRLHDHPSTKAVRGFVPVVEGSTMFSFDGKKHHHLSVGSDGIALGHDGSRLYYTPLASRRLYSVSTDALLDERRKDSEVAMTIDDHGDRGFASDGLEADKEGALYLTDYENNAIKRREDDGRIATILSHPQLIWPDTLSLHQSGYLYFTANQLNRQPQFQEGGDRRVGPYLVGRLWVGAKPVELK